MKHAVFSKPREKIFKLSKLEANTDPLKWSFTVTGRREREQHFDSQRQTNIPVWVYLYCRSISAGTVTESLTKCPIYHCNMPYSVACSSKITLYTKVVCDNGAYSCNTLVSNVKTRKCQITFYVICPSIMN